MGANIVLSYYTYILYMSDLDIAININIDITEIFLRQLHMFFCEKRIICHNQREIIIFYLPLITEINS